MGTWRTNLIWHDQPPGKSACEIPSYLSGAVYLHSFTGMDNNNYQMRNRLLQAFPGIAARLSLAVVK